MVRMETEAKVGPGQGELSPADHTEFVICDTPIENAFARFKRLFSAQLRAKRDASQEYKAALACKLLNRM